MGSMTEMELCLTLGMIQEPDKNRFNATPLAKAQLCLVVEALTIQRIQKQHLGTLNDELWLEMLPWHSIN